MRHTLRRRGAVIGLSGGVDSSVVVALCARSVGADKVLGLFMPERDSSDDAMLFGRMAARAAGVEAVTENISDALDAAGCYRRQQEAIRALVPEYGEGWRCKLVLPPTLDDDRINISQLVVQNPQGQTRQLRLTAQAYLQLVAATNFKQRVRKMTEYYHADRLNYAVAGTASRPEYDQGFFVKQGDGAADFKPIAHLYKSQIYQLAEYLGVPEAIRRRPPTTDTYSMPQTQEEFYFSLPYERMDLCLYGLNHDIPAAAVADAVGLTPAQVERVFRNIRRKRQATQYLHQAPLLVESVDLVSDAGKA